ncbi:MAG: hypothetical protein JKY52_00140 [Flavobacteriales bacterium]|nr:hypothetical protein [Flavobacteriales bacterium]
MKWILVIFLVGAPEGGADVKTIEMETKELCEVAARAVPKVSDGGWIRFVAKAFCVKVREQDSE